MSKVNNRRNVRVSCGAPAKAEGPRGPMRGVCRNLSVAGMFFTGPTLPVGSSAELTIDLPSGRIAAVGEVRYHNSYPEGSGMGIRFSRLSQEHLEAIAAFVAAAG